MLRKNILTFIAIAAISLVIMYIIFLSGLISDVIPAEMGPTSYEHEGAIITSRIEAPKEVYRVGERVDIVPRLINAGNNNITISHSDPAFIIDVYNAAGVKVWVYQYPQLSIGSVVELKPGVPYSWDEDKMKERYDIRLSLPGQYKIVSHTEFLIEEPGKANLEQGLIYSEPIIITVVP